jgi:hypothetical protein
MLRVKLSVVAALAASLLLVGTTGARQIDQKKIANDLKQIGIAYHNYFDSFKKGPAKAADLFDFLDKNKRILDLLENKDIVFQYGVGILDMTDGTSNTVLAYEKDAPTKGGFVLYGDASVKRLTAEEFKKATLAKKK